MTHLLLIVLLLECKPLFFVLSSSRTLLLIVLLVILLLFVVVSLVLICFFASIVGDFATHVLVDDILLLHLHMTIWNIARKHLTTRIPIHRHPHWIHSSRLTIHQRLMNILGVCIHLCITGVPNWQSRLNMQHAFSLLLLHPKIINILPLHFEILLSQLFPLFLSLGLLFVLLELSLVFNVLLLLKLGKFNFQTFSSSSSFHFEVHFFLLLFTKELLPFFNDFYLLLGFHLLILSKLGDSSVHFLLEFCRLHGLMVVAWGSFHGLFAVDEAVVFCPNSDCGHVISSHGNHETGHFG
jgi:hypothetical protein